MRHLVIVLLFWTMCYSADTEMYDELGMFGKQTLRTQMESVYIGQYPTCTRVKVIALRNPHKIYFFFDCQHSIMGRKNQQGVKR